VLLSTARGPLEKLGDDPSMISGRLREDKQLAAVTSGMDDEALARTALSAAMVDYSRSTKKFVRIVGTWLGVVAAVVVVPPIVGLLAGPGLPSITWPSYARSMLACLIIGLFVVLFAFLLTGPIYRIESSRRRALRVARYAVIPAIFTVLVTIGGIREFYTSYSKASVPELRGWAGAVAVGFMGFPLILSLIVSGMALGLRYADSVAFATCWDVLRVDLLELAVAARDPEAMGLDTKAELSLFIPPQAVKERVIEAVIRRYFLELVEEVAGRTVTNFSTAQRAIPFAGDASTSSALAKRGAAFAAGLRGFKERELSPGPPSRASVFTEKFELAAQDRWDELAAPGEFTVSRVWWRGPWVIRTAVALVLLVAALLAPLVLGDPAGSTVRAGLIAVAIAALFSPLSESGRRTYEVLKTASTGDAGSSHGSLQMVLLSEPGQAMNP